MFLVAIALFALAGVHGLDMDQYSSLVTVLKAANAPVELHIDKICSPESNNPYTRNVYIQCVEGKGVTQLYVRNVAWNGTISSTIGLLSSLTALQFENVSIGGSIPTEIGNLSVLKTLMIEKAQLKGSIPSEIGKMTNLGMIKLPSNHLTGSIPLQIGRLTRLEQIFVENNNLTGSIPSEIGKLTWLQSLTCGMNNLKGSLPSELALLTALGGIDVTRNLLSGTLPSGLGSLPLLTVFSFVDNFFTGPIPTFRAKLFDCWFQTYDKPNCFDCRNKPDICRCDKPSFVRDCSNPSRDPTTTTIMQTKTAAWWQFDPRKDGEDTEATMPSSASCMQLAHIVIGVVAASVVLI